MKMKLLAISTARLLCVALLSMGLISARAQTLPNADKRVFFIGHSLVSEVMPTMLFNLAVDAGIYAASDMQTDPARSVVSAQVIIGSPLWWQWQHSSNGSFLGQAVNAREVLPNGRFNVLVLTEGIPLDAGMLENGGNFYRLAHDSNADTQTYYYETWHWLHRIPAGDSAAVSWFNDNYRRDFALDAGYNLTIPAAEIDYDFSDLIRRFRPFINLQAQRTSATAAGNRPMRIIPAGTAFAVLAAGIADGSISGFDGIEDFFSDEIHLNALGNYFVALVHFATIYQQSPQGLTRHMRDFHTGAVTEAATAAQAAALQTLAWQVVSTDPHTGVSPAPVNALPFRDSFETP